MPLQTAEERYKQIIRALPLAERFQLGAMILRDIPEHAVVDYSEEWTEEDLHEFSTSSWRHVISQLQEDDDATTR